MGKQLELSMGHGGYRANSGRKRKQSAGVSHRKREVVNYQKPLHINFKYKTTIRNKTCLKLLKRAILNGRNKGLKVIQFSLQHNHVHLIVEAATNEILTSGMRSITVTMAMGLKAGKVQLERYHLHVLKSLTETKNAVLYVLFNKQKHEKGTSSTVDEYCSLLYLKDALKLIRNFSKDKKISIKVNRIEDLIALDPGNSWLYLNCLELPTSRFRKSCGNSRT